jgi:ferredoxin
VPEVVERLSTVRQAILGCRSFSDGISTVRVRCLGGLTALDLLVLASAVQADALRLNLASCRHCPAGAAVVPIVRHRIDEAVGVLGSNKITMISDTRDAGVTPHEAMRRGLFKSILAPFAEVAYHVSSSERQDGSTPPLAGIPERQNHVLALHGQLPESSTTWRLNKTPQCDDCCRCVGVCPMGALTRQRIDGRRVFGIATERCTGCHACLDFCPKEGLTLLSSSLVRSGESETNARAVHALG